MAAEANVADLQAAWRALAGGTGGQGWSTIPITGCPGCLVRAGRRLPGDEETILFGFRNIEALPPGRLPQGQGFEVMKLTDDLQGSDGVWLALAKRSGASTELFTMMAEDLLSLLETLSDATDRIVTGRLLARVSAWQDFMERHRDGVLSLEAEIGLVGELTLIRTAIELGAETRNLLDTWQGPLGGDQDFIPGTGAIEVKATLSTCGFPASISSLNQLDDSIRQPIFLVAIRFSLDHTGETLPELAASIRSHLENRFGDLDTFDARLLQAGLLPAATQRYTRRFVHRATVVLTVSEGFPRLTRGNVHTAINNARYEVDLDLSGSPDVGLPHALRSLGML